MDRQLKKKWRSGVIGKQLMFTLAKLSFVAVGFCAVPASADATAHAKLEVELNVSHGLYSSKEEESFRSVVFLVIDRSGSMAEKTLKDGRTPDEALFESLKMQLDSIPDGTELHIIPFSNKIWDETFVASLDSEKRASVLDLVKKMSPRGQTVLYDAQDVALTQAAKILDSDETAEVRVLVYTDGEHLTPWDYEGEYKACFQIKAGGIGRKRFENNPTYHEDRAVARRKFEAKFRDLMAKPNMEVEYEWLSASPKPEIEMRTKTAIASELSSHTPELGNPFESPQQTFKGALHLPISDKCWEEVKGRPFTVEWKVGEKTATASMKLESGVQKCDIEWPFRPEDKPSAAEVTVRALPEGKKFVLKDSKSVGYQIPAFLKGVEIKVPEREYYEKDKNSAFTAVSVGRATGYAWKVDGKNVPCSSSGLDYVFKDAGAHEVSVTVMYVNGITASAGRSVRVWPTPSIAIESPVEYDGDPESAKLRAGAPIALRAKVEGAFESAVWTFAQDDKPVATIPSAVKEGLASGNYTPKKGGLYDVTLSAEGLGGRIEEYVQIYVKGETR